MLTLLLALAALPQGTDTTIALRGATRLELSSFEGGITVNTWNRPQVRVEADHDDDTRIEVEAGGRSLELHAHTRYGPAEVTWRLTIPADLALELSSQDGDIVIEGARGEVSATTVEGSITLRGGTGFIALQSVEGDIELSDVSGEASLNTVDGAIRVRNATGVLKASVVDGDITLDEVTASRVEANSVDGSIRLSGTLQPGGRYSLTSHDGDVTVIAPAIDAEVSVSTFSGDFESDFPVTLQGGASRKRLNFTLGKGSARLDLESFDGTVALRRGTGRP